MKAKAVEKPPFLPTEQAAQILGMTPRNVRILCAKGAILGAFKLGRNWAVPNPPVVLGKKT
jgi:hypothetical protein